MGDLVVKMLLPDGVQNIAVLEYSQELVVCGDFMEVGSFLVGEEQVRLPDGVQHGWVQVQGVVGVLTVRQPGVVPLLSQEDVYPVVLPKENKWNVNYLSQLQYLMQTGKLLFSECGS